MRKLQRLNNTNLASRYAACKAVCDRLSGLLLLLNEQEGGDNAKHAVEARSLLCAVDCRFVFMLVFLCGILVKRTHLSRVVVIDH